MFRGMPSTNKTPASQKNRNHMPKRVCISMKPGNAGGPSSFARKLTAGLENRGIAVTYSLADRPYDAVLVVNATRELGALWQCKREGIRIVQRLGGLNWAHRFLPVGWKGFVLAEIRNQLMRLVRARIADAVVYQSHYAQDMWEQKYGPARVPTTIIYNGVDLSLFHPEGERYQPRAEVCLISVEGALGNDPWLIPVQVAQKLIEQGLDVELLMFGAPQFGVEAKLSKYPFVKFMGVVRNHDLPQYYRAALAYIYTDVVMGWCPNSVIEALACGTPVVGFRVGALPEMLGALCNDWCVEYGSDPFRMEEPKGIAQLATVVRKLAEDQEEARLAARRLAEERYGLEQMVDRYAAILFQEG
ncbi:MAG: glycosyltransferase family 4 protein [candidate division WOR-3 bacterium]